jgi:hypothetical protein
MSPAAAPVAARPRRPSLGQRLAGNAVAMVLVVGAWLLSGLTPSLPPLPQATPSETAVPTATPSPIPTVAIATRRIEFPVVADAYVYAGRPDLNYGAAPELRVDADPETLTYLRFRVTGIDQPVLGVHLRISALSRQTLGFDVRSAPNGWAESQLSYGTHPTPGGDIIGSSGLIAAASEIEVALSVTVSGNGDYSFVLSTRGSTALTFASREAGAATAPTLIIEVAAEGASATPAQ